MYYGVNIFPLKGVGGIRQKFFFARLDIFQNLDYMGAGTFYGIEKKCSVADICFVKVGWLDAFHPFLSIYQDFGDFSDRIVIQAHKMSLTDPRTSKFGPQLVFNLKFQVLEEFSKIVNFCFA